MLNDDAQLDVFDLAVILFSLGDCPPGGPCPGDLDASGGVGVADVLTLFFSVPCEPGNCAFDFTGDGAATVEDLLIYVYFLFI